MTARRMGLAIAIVTALGSGAYVFIYLYRWEWNRALIAGMIFIAVELALLGAAILDRLNNLGRRMDDLERGIVQRDVLARIQESAPAPRRHFAWLTDTDRASVFVPVLMGAGVVISALAWAVERVARRTGRPVLEQRLAARIAPIALVQPGASVATVPPPQRPVKRILSATIMITVAVAAVVALAGATQSRPDTIRDGTATELKLNVFSNSRMDPTGAAVRLWEACSGTVPRAVSARSFQGSDETAVRIELRPGIGPNGERKLRGCLEDATLDNIQAAVVNVRHSGR
jgi:hypothetical protein